MANISIKIDLLKLVGKEMEVNGRDGLVSGYFIPYKANHVYIGEKGKYLSLDAIEPKQRREGSKDTHFIKISVPKEVYDQLSKEERESIPIVGNAIYWGERQFKPSAPQAEPEPHNTNYSDDLPF